MMRHGERYSVSVRKEDGSITTENRTFVSVRKKIKLLNIPLLRGAVNFIEMLILSYKNALHLRRCLRPNRGGRGVQVRAVAARAFSERDLSMS